MRPHASRPLSKVSAHRDSNLHLLLLEGTLATLLALANPAREVHLQEVAPRESPTGGSE